MIMKNINKQENVKTHDNRKKKSMKKRMNKKNNN